MIKVAKKLNWRVNLASQLSTTLAVTSSRIGATFFDDGEDQRSHSFVYIQNLLMLFESEVEDIPGLESNAVSPTRSLFERALGFFSKLHSIAIFAISLRHQLCYSVLYEKCAN